MGAQRHNVPHFKGLIMLYLDFEAQGRGSTFTFCHAHLKKAILHLKMATVRFDLNTAVCGHIQFLLRNVPEKDLNAGAHPLSKT